MTFKIFERTDKLTKKGVPLVFILQPGGKKIPTGYSCKQGSWHQESQSVIATGAKKDPLAPQLNAKLKRASIALQDIIDEGLPIAVIRDRYSEYLDSLDVKVQKSPEAPAIQLNTYQKNRFKKLTSAGKDFFLQVFNLTLSHRSDWSEGHRHKFISLAIKILDYEPNFHIGMLTEEWWRGFVSWCIEEKDNVNNTIDTDSKVFSGMIKEFGGDYKLAEKIRWGYIEPQILGLSWDKVLKLPTVDLSDHPSLTIKDSRTLWLAAAFTGRRWSEINGKKGRHPIGPENFFKKDGIWMYRNIGKGIKVVEIPLLPEAVEFFQGIDFRLPVVPNPVVNVDIKEVCKIAGYSSPITILTPVDATTVKKEVVPEWKTVHYHTARHSYGLHITELSAGMAHDDKFISYMLGHASYQTSWKYKNRSEESNLQMFKEIIKAF